MCSLDYREARSFLHRLSRSGKSISGGFSYGVLGVSGSLTESKVDNYTSSDHSAFKRRVCRSLSKQQATQSFQFFSQKVVAPGVVEAWSRCRSSQEDLVCWMKPQSGTQVAFHVEYRVPGAGPLTNITTEVIEGDSEIRQLTSDEIDSFYGDEPFHIRRQSDDVSLSAKFRGIDDRGVIRSCNGFVAAELELPEPEAVEVTEFPDTCKTIDGPHCTRYEVSLAGYDVAGNGTTQTFLERTLRHLPPGHTLRVTTILGLTDGGRGACRYTYKYGIEGERVRHVSEPGACEAGNRSERRFRTEKEFNNPIPSDGELDLRVDTYLCDRDTTCRTLSGSKLIVEAEPR